MLTSSSISITATEPGQVVADPVQPPSLTCPKCGGRLFFERGSRRYEDEWACVNCGRRLAAAPLRRHQAM